MTATLPVTAGASLGGRLIEEGYVQARFGGTPVLVGPALAAELKALREKQPYDRGDADG